MKNNKLIRPGFIIFCALISLIIIPSKNLHANESALQVDITDFSASKIYMFDTENEQWNLLRDIKYHFTDTGRVDSVEVYSPIVAGHRLDDEVISYKYDELGRTVKILIKEDGRNERGYEYSYFEDTELPLETKVITFRNFVTPLTSEHTRWEYDGEGKLILYEEVKPIGSKKGDSIVYEYDDQDRVSKRTHYRYEPISDQRIPWYLSTFNYDGETLEQINIDFWNLDGEEWVTYQRIVDIEEPTIAEAPIEGVFKGASLPQFKNLGEIRRYSHVKEQFFNEEWNINNAVKLTKYSDGIVEREITNLDINPASIEILRRFPVLVAASAIAAAIRIHFVHRGLLFYGNPKPGESLDVERLLKLAAYILNEGGDIVFQSRIEPDYSQVKSTSAQIILTLTTQTYTSQTGEWNNRFKQEFYYEGNAVSVNGNPLEDRIRIFPNPSNGNLKIRFHDIDGPVSIEILNGVGQVVANKTIGKVSAGFTFTMETAGMYKGIYFVKVHLDNRTIVKKVILK